MDPAGFQSEYRAELNPILSYSLRNVCICMYVKAAYSLYDGYLLNATDMCNRGKQAVTMVTTIAGDKIGASA